MPLSRNRKLSRSEQKKRRQGREYRRALHKGYLLLLAGNITKEQYEQWKFHAKALLMGTRVRRVAA